MSPVWFPTYQALRRNVNGTPESLSAVPVATAGGAAVSGLSVVLLTGPSGLARFDPGELPLVKSRHRTDAGAPKTRLSNQRARAAK